MKVNFSQIIVKQIGFPSVTTTFIINVLKDSPGYRRDRVAIHGIEITISLRLLIVWGIDVNKLDENTIIRIAFPFVEKIIKEKLRDKTLSVSQEYQLTTENQESEYPYDLKKIPSIEDIRKTIYEIEDTTLNIGSQIATNLIADKIITIRDNINAIFYEKYKQNLLKLVQERNILYLFRKIDSNESFTYFIATLGNLATDINKEILFDILELKKNDTGSIQLLEKYLKLDTENETDTIISILKNINRIRQGFPIHTDKSRIIEALKYFRIDYPPENFNDSKNILMENYKIALEKLLISIKFLINAP